METLHDTGEMELPSLPDEGRATDGSAVLSEQIEIEPVLEEGRFPSVDTFWGD